MSSVPSQRTNALEASLWNMSEFPDLLDFVTSNRHSVNVLGHASIAVDWKETPEAHIFEADIPGLSKQDVTIQVDEGQRVLQISGERVLEEPVDEKNKVHRFERPHGSFSRRFLLPKNARLHEEVKAKMENGVLTLTILKKPDQETRIRSIQISVEGEERGK